MYYQIPPTLLGKWLPLPYEPRTAAHAKEPWTLGVHRMLGYADQLPMRSVMFTRDASGTYRATLDDGYQQLSPLLPQTQIIAAASFMQGNVVTDVLRRIKTFGGDESDVLKGLLDDAARARLNFINGFRHDVRPWAGVGVLPCSPDGAEFIFARKDHLHPCPWYCGRLSFIGGSMDPNEVLGDWGGESGSAYVAMLRECFEEIRDVAVAAEIAGAVTTYRGPHWARCYLSSDDGDVSEGSIRLFAARAPNADAWTRWRASILGEAGKDGLGEAYPEIVSRADLVAALRQDAEADASREGYLSQAPTLELIEALQDDNARFSRKGMPDKQKWLANREAAREAGTFPLRSRGDFAFIAGIAGAIEHVLKADGLL